MQLEANIRRARVFRWPLCVALCLVPVLGGCGAVPLTLGGLIQQLLIGLILGSIYALIALGYTLVYGVIKLINFAHGDIFMLGAFFGYYVLRFTIRWLYYTHGVSLIICFVIATTVSAVLCAALAMLMERLAYRPLRRSTRIAALITAVGVSFLLENAGIIVFGPNPKSFEPKTFETYQLELSATPDFAHPRRHEVWDTTQRAFSEGSLPQPAFARVRLVNRAGSSEWSPVLEIAQGRPGGFVEAPEAPAGSTAPGPGRPGAIGFTRKAEGRREVIVLNWKQGAGKDIRLHSVFSDASGETIAYKLPVASGANVRLPLFSMLIVVVTVILLWALNLLISRSTFGMSMRALSFDMDAAKLMGVNTDRVIALTFAVGGACAAVAGSMVGVYNQSIEPLMGILPGIKAFVAAVVGGIGSLPGAAAGGMIMGLSEALVKGYISPAWSTLADALAFAILILVLLFKPSGIFGGPLREKV